MKRGRLIRSLRSLVWKPSVTEEVDSELDFHIEMRTRELMTRGMDRERAQAEAVARFGDLGRVHSTLERIGRRRDRRERRSEWLSELRHDALYALRQLRRSPAFALVTILTLGVGIGATTSIFSAVYAVVLRALPYHDPGSIVRVYPHLDGNDESARASAFFALRDEARTVEHLAALEYTTFTLVETDQLPSQHGGARATATYFTLLGVKPLLGRTFLAEEETPGRDQVAVLSHRLWTERFNADHAVLGRTVAINSRPVTIIGVMPASFTLSAGAEEMWTPLALTPEERADYQKGFLALMGRLRPGTSVAQATTELTAIDRRQAEREPRANPRRTVRLDPLYATIVGSFRERLFILLGAVGLVLLIACGNVANLLLARGASRSREIALRAAIGAGRGRLVRQLLTESVMIGLAGSVAGLVLAIWGIKSIIAMSPEDVPRLAQAQLDPPTVAFALVLSFLSALLFGIVPALRLAGTDLQASLSEGGRGAIDGSTRDRLRRSLVVAEVALTLVLLVGAGLLIRSGIRLQGVEPGFDPARLFTGMLTLPSARYPTADAVVRTYRDIHDGVRAIPGVDSAALVFPPPMTDINASAGITPEGRPLDASGQMSAGLHLATPGVFATMRIPIRAGRDFTDDDVTGRPRVAIVNEAAARSGWPGENALGKRFALLRDSADAPIWWEVVGIVGDVRERGLREPPQAEMYLALAQTPPIILGALQRSMFVVAKTRGEPMAQLRQIKEAVAKVDPSLPLFGALSMEDRLANSMASARFNSVLLTVLGVIGLMLATVGIFGVISYFVSQRQREIGVRMALGATPRTVLLLVVRQGVRPVVLGVLLGLAASAAVTRILGTLLYDVSATDPVTLIAVAAGVLGIAIAAAAIPARRAARIDPLAALRE
ncbi:MAG TPA: ABC transporter permease [Gemmatimonadaceae bacterium]|nr:ABC transporter permease [Gemmatimonadaceae bacterium]